MNSRTLSLFAILLTAASIASCGKSSNDTPDQSAAMMMSDSMMAAAEADAMNAAATTPVTTWSYDSSADEMGRGTIKKASIMSTTELNFGSPYDGPQRATLQLRQHPKYGKDVILFIERGQFHCDYDNCTVTVRFGDGKAETVSASEPADNSSTALFLKGYDKFLRNLRTVPKVAIEARFYQEGNHVIEFDVAGFNW